MQEPFEKRPGAGAPGTRAASGDEVVATPDEEAALQEAEHALASTSTGNAPLREIATAFRMNAEALHTLKQMQGDLADSVKRGDRSQLVVQSTKALNETFRNLSAVQRELLSRLDATRAENAPARSPVVPLLLLGLLVVLLGGIYVVLDAIDRKGAGAPQTPPADIAQKVMDSWKQGRVEGAEHADAEVRRLTARLEEEQARGRRLEPQLDARGDELGSAERARRSAELERDTFASQIQKARAEVLARKTLEEEVLSLSAQADSKDRILKDLQGDLDLTRRQNAFLRQRLADYGMGFTEEDPPWRPGVAAGAEDPEAPGRITKLPPSQQQAKERLALLIAGRKKVGMDTTELEAQLARLERGAEPTGAEGSGSDRPEGGAPAPASGSMSDAGAPPETPDGAGARPPADTPRIGWARSAVPPPAAVSADEMERAANRMGPVPRPGGAAAPAARTPAAGLPAGPSPAPAQPAPAAYGGDGPGALPPPVLRKRGTLQREPANVGRVQTHLNALLDTTSGRAGWQISRIRGVAPDRLGGVVLMRYDDAGRPVERYEVSDMRITLDRTRKTVSFDLRDGVRVARNRSTALPTSGARIVVAAGGEVDRWSASSLALINRR